MNKIFAVLLAVSFLSTPATSIKPFAASAEAQEYRDYDARPSHDYDRPDYARPDDAYGPRFSRQQLENLLAPVALYPDPLLAQILVAATFSDQIQDAAGFLRHRNDPYAIDSAPWDVSVKAVAHYPSVLNMMADRIDWTVALGQAYVEQPGEVMSSVQFLRWRAHRAGNLVSNPYQEVVVEREYIEIVPYRPEVIYVPVYEPDVIFVRPAAFITFGPAFPIGVWLNRDCDWRSRRVYYHGWRGGGWIERSRPRVQINNVYVNNSFRSVQVNREVVRREVNVQNLNRFTSVNREANFNNFERRGRGRDGDRSNRRDTDNRRGDNNLSGRAAVERTRGRDDRSLQNRDDRTPRADNRSFRGRGDAALQSSGNSATIRSREDNSAKAREERLARARAQSAPQAQGNDARDNRWRRGRNDGAPQALENRSRRTAEDNRPPAALSRDRRPKEQTPNAQTDNGNRSFRTREERSQPRDSQGQRGRDERREQVTKRQQPAPVSAPQVVRQRNGRDENGQRKADRERKAFANRGGDRGEF